MKPDHWNLGGRKCRFRMRGADVEYWEMASPYSDKCRPTLIIEPPSMALRTNAGRTLYRLRKWMIKYWPHYRNTRRYACISLLYIEEINGDGARYSPRRRLIIRGADSMTRHRYLPVKCSSGQLIRRKWRRQHIVTGIIICVPSWAVKSAAINVGAYSCKMIIMLKIKYR